MTTVFVIAALAFIQSPLFARHYHEGEHITFKMTAVNKGKAATHRYSALAQGVVSPDKAGTLVEEFDWSNLVLDGKKLDLGPQNGAFKQVLCLTPHQRTPFPDLSHVNPNLIGPITDLLTFYVDLQLAAGIPSLAKAGDHAYISFGKPSSWADGSRVILGEDVIDFDLTVKKVDLRKRVATLLVRHVPPPDPKLKLDVDWMKKPVADTPNNWVQVEKVAPDRYVAGVGKEIFDVWIEVSLNDGRILSAKQDNVVEVLERVCPDSSLSTGSKPVRYRITRRIVID